MPQLFVYPLYIDTYWYLTHKISEPETASGFLNLSFIMLKMASTDALENSITRTYILPYFTPKFSSVV